MLAGRPGIESANMIGFSRNCFYHSSLAQVLEYNTAENTPERPNLEPLKFRFAPPLCKIKYTLRK